MYEWELGPVCRGKYAYTEHVPNSNPLTGAEPRFHPAFLVFWSIWLLWAFGYETAWQRLNTQVEGTIISSRDIPPSRGPRYATEYTLFAHNGQTQIYLAGATDASLLRSIPVGAYIKKRRWHLSFEENGQDIEDFSIIFYTAILLSAATSLCWGAYNWRRQ